MHNNSYNIKVALSCSENLIKSFEEVKQFFGFKLKNLDLLNDKILLDEYDVLLMDNNVKTNISLENIQIPKVLIKKQGEKNNKDSIFNLVITLPINLIDFNQNIINLSQKHKFGKNSLIKIKDYVLDKNERTLKRNDKKIKITEKEIYFIETLFESTEPVNKNFILENVWKYSKSTDTHTVETHIYRLRQKIKNNFNDNNFIKHSTKGYTL